MSDTNKTSGYYRHSAFIIRILKYASILCFIVFIISCIVIFKKDITVENIQLLAKYINIDSSSSEYVDEFSITADDDYDIVMLRNNLCIVNNNSISLYDLSGQKLFSYKFALSSPAVVSDEHSILVYDIKGNTLTAFNSFSKIRDFKFQGNVLSAHLNDTFFSVITQDESYNSSLTVFEYKNQERDYVDVYTLKSSDFLTSSAISHSGRYLVTSSVESLEGSYVCGIHIYDTSSKSVSPAYSHKISDELPIKVGFADNNKSVYLITDSSVHFYNSDFEETFNYKFNQSKIERFYENDEMIILTEKNNLSGNSVMLIGLSKYGDELFQINISDEIYDISIGDENIFALGKLNVYKISQSNDVFEVTGFSNLDSKCFSLVSDTNDICYALNDTTAVKIDF